MDFIVSLLNGVTSDVIEVVEGQKIPNLPDMWKIYKLMTMQ